MKKSFTKIISTLLVLITIMSVMSLLTFNVSAVTYSGTCSTNLTWMLDTSTGKLAIGGTGAMNNYSYWNLPWGSYRYQIKTATIDNSVTSIGDYALGWCDNLVSVTIGNGVTTIGNCAFSNCYKLANVTIPDSVTIIGEDSFEYCYGLASVIIGNSVTTIGISAFDSCRSLENVTIGNGVIKVEEYAFYDCDNLTDVYYDGTEEEWNEITIEDGNESLLNATIHYNCISGVCGDNLTWKLNTETGELTIEGTGAMYSYNRPWESYEDEIKIITIGNGVTTIGDMAFYSCDSLISVTIPDSVTIIGENAFQSCDSLTSVTIPDSVTEIGEAAFAFCQNLINITLGNSVTKIGDNAFEYCGSLTSITIPDSVTTIGDYAFWSCDSLTSVTIGNSVIVIGNEAFRLCNMIASIEVDTANEYYSSDSYGVLYNKDKTKLIQYPVGNERIDFTIPDSVTEIGKCAFEGCGRLINITIPDGINTIGDFSFRGGNIKNVIIGNSVTTIGFEAFYSCYYLTDITIPNSVTIIKDSAFQYCSRLANVHYNGTKAEWNKISIGTDNEPLLNATIYYNYCSHSYESVVTAPTCTERGYTTYTCECGDTYITDYVDATGHSHTAEVTTPATHTTTGVMTYTCACGDTYTETIGKIAEHSHNAVVTAPTCTEQGYTTYTCECGDSYISDYVDELGHNYQSTITTPATHTTTGVMTFTCGCGDTYTKEIDKITTHDFKTTVTAPTCTEQGYTTYACECGERYVDDYVPEKGHDEGIWSVTKPSTPTESGVMHLFCGECGFVLETKVIPATGKVRGVAISDISLDYKASTTITPSITVDSGVKYTVTYSSSDPSVASIDANGKVVAGKTGSATITVTVTDEFGNTVSDTCEVKVNYNWWQWIIVIVLFGWIWY